jgi:hypothetical protein
MGERNRAQTFDQSQTLRLSTSYVVIGASADLLHRQRQALIDQVHGSLRIRPMLTGSGAAARMMGNFHQGKRGDSEEFRFGFGQLHENRLAECNCRLALLLQFDCIVDTPRGAGASSTQTSDDRITPAYEFVHSSFRRSLHVGWLGLEQHFGSPIFLLNQLCQLLKHRRRIRLAIIDDADDLPFQGIQSRHQRPVFGIHSRSRVKHLERRHQLHPLRENTLAEL